MNFKIAVRDLAAAIYQSGDLTPEFFYNKEDIDGRKIHQIRQKKYNKESIAEYHIKYSEIVLDDCIELNGFIDGLIIEDKNTIIEEIKSTKEELENIDEDYHKEYLAQLKIYSYMYLKNNNLSAIDARLVFINAISLEEKIINFHFTIKSLSLFFTKACKEYLLYIHMVEDDYQRKQKSLNELRFPYETYRDGQKDLMKAAYSILKSNDVLYACAPTGIGKTISTIYPALKVLKEPNEKVFYLTSKGTQKELAINTIKKMMENGLDIRLLEITAKEESCINNQGGCDPDNCPYAKDYFKKLRKAIKDIFKNNIIDKSLIRIYAKKHKLCPFEFSLALSNYSNIIVCDYNYAFDPIAKLHTYFEYDTVYKSYLLIDEAHNLVDRSRGMYSSSISIGLLERLKKNLRKYKPSVKGTIEKIIEIIKTYDDKYVENYYLSKTFDETLVDLFASLQEKISDSLYRNKKTMKERGLVLNDLVQLVGFNKVLSLYCDASRFGLVKDQGDTLINVICLDANKYIKPVLSDISSGAILFSATLLPISYYEKLITEENSKYISIPSPFPKDNFELIFLNKVKTYYKTRKESVDSIVDSIDVLVKNHKGNYIVFFPSYEYLKMVEEKIKGKEYEVIVQKDSLTKQEREEIIDKFNDSSSSKVALFVLGGVFSEGIDLIGDKLSGVIVVGLGIPQFNYQNEELKAYYEEKFSEGYSYAYTYPGFNKVLQGVGRLIRSSSDIGVAVIIDSRITSDEYLNLLPYHWKNYHCAKNIYELDQTVSWFWNKKDTINKII